MQSPRMPGSGGEVRTYYFVDALAKLGEVTLISLVGCDPADTDRHIVQICKKIVHPPRKKPPVRTESEKLLRLASWLKTFRVMAFPWRNGWGDFLSFCAQFCPLNQIADSSSIAWSKRLLALMLRTEFRLAARLFNPPPVGVFFSTHAFRTIWPEVAGILKQESFDLIWFEHSVTYPFVKEMLKEIKNAPLICNAHNVESKLQERLGHASDSGGEADYWKIQGRLLKNLESKAFAACDLVFTCSEQDKELAQALAPRTEYSVVGNGVNIDYFRPASKTLQSLVPTLLFTGAFGYGPNDDAIKYFISEVFPLIKAKKPDCKFIFAGASAQTAFDSFGLLDPGISCVSSPPDIRPCFHQATVFVVPLRSGGGTRLKILEAMAMECAIVSTRIGAEGIPCRDGEHILMADSPAEFAELVLRLLDDPALRAKIEKQAGVWVRENYNWNRLCEKALASIKPHLPPAPL